MKKLQKTNYAFIDSQNLNLGIRSQGWKLDFARFRVYLRDKYQISQAYLFIGFVEGNQPLYTDLQKAGYIVIFKPTLAIRRGRKVIIKGNVDAELVLHTMIEYPNFSQAVIVTGDGDFYCLVQHLNDKGKLLKLLVPNVIRYSKLLKPFAPNKLDFMNNLKEKLQKRIKKERQLPKDEL